MNERAVSYDDEDPFSDVRVRHAFVRKVLSIVVAQLLLTIAIVLPFILVEEVKTFSLRYRWGAFICLAVMLTLMLVLGCCESVRRAYPINLFLLFIFTVAEGGVLGFFCGQKYPTHVLMAFGITAVVCFALIVFAMQVKWDFTGILPFILIGLVILVVLLIVSIFYRNRIFLIVISSLGVFLFAIYLIVDVQMILGGQHRYKFEPEDYVMAAISIYMDIITFFIYLLSLIGLISDD